MKKILVILLSVGLMFVGNVFAVVHEPTEEVKQSESVADDGWVQVIKLQCRAIIVTEYKKVEDVGVRHTSIIEVNGDHVLSLEFTDGNLIKAFDVLVGQDWMNYDGDSPVSFEVFLQYLIIEGNETMSQRNGKCMEKYLLDKARL